jgi:hypothetical protein
MCRAIFDFARRNSQTQTVTGMGFTNSVILIPSSEPGIMNSGTASLTGT